jgi:hypothetical protein
MNDPGPPVLPGFLCLPFFCSISFTVLCENCHLCSYNLCANLCFCTAVLCIDGSEFHQFGFSRDSRFWHKVRALHVLGWV